MEKILNAYSRFVVALQNKLQDGEFVMTQDLFLQLLGEAGE